MYNAYLTQLNGHGTFCELWAAMLKYLGTGFETSVQSCCIVEWFGVILMYGKCVIDRITTVEFKHSVKKTTTWLCINRPFSKMAATDLYGLKLNWMKNWYQHWKEHLCFSNLAKFQRIRFYINLGNVRWNLYKFTDICMTGGIRHTRAVIQMSVSFSFFNLHFLSWYYTWYAETVQG